MFRILVHVVIVGALFLGGIPIVIDTIFDPNYGTTWQIVRGTLPGTLCVIGALYIIAAKHGVLDVALTYIAALLASTVMIVQYGWQWIVYYGWSFFLAPDFQVLLLMGAVASWAIACFCRRSAVAFH